MYAVNPASGHVRWEFPQESWFRYWIKHIDLPPTAQFRDVSEVKGLVYVTASGPASRVFGLKPHHGQLVWEHRPAGQLTGTVGPSQDQPTLLYLSLLGGNTSWLQAINTTTGKAAWTSQPFGAQFDQLEIVGSELLVMNKQSNLMLSFDNANGTLLWQRNGSFCPTPSPVRQIYSGIILLSQDCSSMQTITAVNATTGRDIWTGWSPAKGTTPQSPCSWLTVHHNTIFFGCSCEGSHMPSLSSYPQNHTAASGSATTLQRALQVAPQPHFMSTGLLDSVDSTASHMPSVAQHSAQAAIDSSSGSSPQNHQPLSPSTSICFYALDLSTGKPAWSVSVPGNGSFPDDAQTWGLSPVVTDSAVAFPSSSAVYGVDCNHGKLLWTLPLAVEEQLPAWQLPAVDEASGNLLVMAERSRANHTYNNTAIYAVDPSTGKAAWSKVLNGTFQQPAANQGASTLKVEHGGVFVESCRRQTCCLRMLNATTGRAQWRVCLDVVPGVEATDPKARFAIWLITIATICSIAILIVGACFVYVQRWADERRMLHSGSMGRYHVLHDHDSEDDGEFDERYRSSRRVRSALLPPMHTAAGARGERAATSNAPAGAALRVPVSKQSQLDRRQVAAHQEAVWVQERNLMSMLRPRLPSDDNPPNDSF
eukprot:jgi/Chrzof1/4455/Cz14g13230.t1